MRSRSIEEYIPLVHFIADICGPKFEVVLHDLSTPEKSVIAIRNNHISGRNLNSPLTDLALKILKQGDYEDKDFITNYIGYVRKNIEVLSSTYFIKNEDSELIGMLCVNNDTSDITNIANLCNEFLDRFKYTDKDLNKDQKYEEHISNSVVDLTKSLVRETINKMNIPVPRMTIEEKINLVQEFDKIGIFLLKGGAAYIAKKLKISEATVYRYLNKDKSL